VSSRVYKNSTATSAKEVDREGNARMLHRETADDVRTTTLLYRRTMKMSALEIERVGSGNAGKHGRSI